MAPRRERQRVDARLAPVRVALGGLGFSLAGFVSLVAYEGYKDTAYVPVPGDVPTIGIGTTDGVKMGDKITPPQAIQRAARDVSKFEGAIKRCVKVPLAQHEYDSFTLLSYNIGESAFCSSTLVKILNTGDYAGACKQILRWNQFQGQVLPGLVKRREGEYKMCMGEKP